MELAEVARVLEELWFLPCSLHRHSLARPFNGSVDIIMEVLGTEEPFKSVQP